jgi:hydroxymethylpyrimidine/phosphomethylpyrimidine kinase
MKHGMTLHASSSMTRSCVLVFAGLDPSGGAGIQADSQAIAAMGAHALPIVTTKKSMARKIFEVIFFIF